MVGWRGGGWGGRSFLGREGRGSFMPGQQGWVELMRMVVSFIQEVRLTERHTGGGGEAVFVYMTLKGRGQL